MIARVLSRAAVAATSPLWLPLLMLTIVVIYLVGDFDERPAGYDYD